MRKHFYLWLPLLLVAAVFVACSEDDEDGTNQPTTGTLHGTVIFHGEWPDSGTVQLSVFTSWNNEGAGCYWCAQSAGGPPAYYTAANFLQDPDPNNLVDPDTLTFSIPGIALGTYEVVVTGWRKPSAIGNVECDEPVIGMLGANPGTADTIPDAITFTANNAAQTVELHTWFNRRLPVLGCDDLGRIDGTIDLAGTWPAPGVAAIITTMPYSAWQPQGIAGYRGRSAMLSSADPYFAFSQAYGTYYVSFWTNEQPPNNKYLGAYGVNTAIGDARPDALPISAISPHVTLNEVPITHPAPHWVSGTVTFNGERPAEGVMVLLSSAFPPQGPPSGLTRITDDAETLYAVSGFADGTYYVSLWKNSTTEYVLYGAWYDPEGGDTDPDPVTFDAQNLGVNGIDITGQP